MSAAPLEDPSFPQGDFPAPQGDLPGPLEGPTPTPTQEQQHQAGQTLTSLLSCTPAATSWPLNGLPGLPNLATINPQDFLAQMQNVILQLSAFQQQQSPQPQLAPQLPEGVLPESAEPQAVQVPALGEQAVERADGAAAQSDAQPDAAPMQLLAAAHEAAVPSGGNMS